MRKIVIYALIAFVLILLFYYTGAKIVGVIGGFLVALGIIKTGKQKHDDAKKRIDEAGENIEAKKHDADSALDFYDDFFDDSNGRRKP
jgi:Na+/H+-translocating membrane pyrophosphatase